MDIEIKTWLYDILNSIKEIEEYFKDKPKRFDMFVSDIKTKRAVERNLEIIGEAVNRIQKKNDSIKISNARKIIDARNRITHGYDTVSDDVVWGILIKYLPDLKKEVNNLINE